MEWWNDLWLNEGFATFMEYFAMEEVFPELHSVSTFCNYTYYTISKMYFFRANYKGLII